MRFSGFGFAVLACSLSAGVATAGIFSFSGTFTQDDQLQIFLFTAPSNSTMLRTWAYAGGTNSNGDVVLAGGFDPMLSVYAANGGLVGSSTLITANDDGSACADFAPPCVNPDPLTAGAFDAMLVLDFLDPGGTYAVVLSQSGNFPLLPDFASGFLQAGQGNYTAVGFPCGGTSFCDSSLAQRTGNWSVDITGVSAAADITGTVNGVVPEPGSIALLAAGLTALAMLRRGRKPV